MARKKADIEGQLSFVAISDEGGTGKTLKLPEVYKYEIKKSNILVFDSVLNYSLIEYKPASTRVKPSEAAGSTEQ